MAMQHAGDSRANEDRERTYVRRGSVNYNEILFEIYSVTKVVCVAWTFPRSIRTLTYVTNWR